MRFDIGTLMFVATAFSLAVINPPRTSEFDLQRREFRLTIGWPPILGRRMTIPFDTIREAKVSQFLHLDDDLGVARPALVLNTGKKILLSTYKRSPKRCRVVVEEVRHCLRAAGTKTLT